MNTKRLVYVVMLCFFSGCGEKPKEASAPKPDSTSTAQPPATTPAAPPQQFQHPTPLNPHTLQGQAQLEPPSTIPPTIAPKPDEPGSVTANFMTVQAKLPAAWKSMPPSNSMRLAQFSVPAATGNEAGELVVFYFPAGGGGRQQENIARWASQFSSADGNAVQPTITQTTIHKLNVTQVELNGSYSRGAGMGMGGGIKQNQTLLAAIIITPDQRNITLHLYGPKATIDKQRNAWDSLIKSLKLVN